MSLVPLLAWAAIAPTAIRAQEPLELIVGAQPEALVLSGAQVWTDGRFVERPLYIADGSFVGLPPEGAREIDLSGRYLSPPFADAHVHHFTRAESAPASRELFLSRGFLYLANLCGPHGAREATAPFTNGPTGVDVLFSHGALTGLTGHPVPLYRTLHQRRGLSEATFFEQNDDNTFYRVDSALTLGRKLDLLLATGPDLVKIIQSRISLQEPGSVHALDPALVPGIVARAHAAGLPVVAHVDDAVDFLHAVESGVDWLAHTPGFGRRDGDPLEEFLLSPEDARLAAEAGVVVITTAGAYDDAREDNRAAQQAVDRNLATLRAAGVRLIFGSDDWKGPDTELRALSTHAALQPAELLRMLCETTPRTLYPGRDIGHLREGFEGSLVALAGNPIEDPANLGRIEAVVKRGAVLALARD